MCCWKRLFNLEQQIAMLNRQTCASRICFHLVNNNPDKVNELNLMVERFKQTYTKIRVFVTHYENKFFGFQRFFYIRDVIYKKYIADYVIIIDDDQLFDVNWVQSMYNIAKPKTYIGWYGKKWTTNMNYWNGSAISVKRCLINAKHDISNVDYVGTGGCIIDTNAFCDESELWIIPNDLPKGVTAYNVEDLWLSFVLNKRYNWNLRRSFCPPSTDLNVSNQLSLHASLCLSLYKEKQQLFEYLVYKMHWLT